MSKNTLLSALINYVSANSSGNVVVAAPSSGYALDVTGTGRFTGFTTFSASVGVGTSTITNGTAFGGGNQVNRLKVESSTYTCLEINGSTFGSSIQFTYGTNLPNQVGSLIGYNYGSGTVNELSISNILSGPTIFGTNNTERMRITSAGNIGVGTTTPTDYGVGSTLKNLQVTGSGYGVLTASAGSVIAWLIADTTAAATGTQSNHDFKILTNNTERIRITTGGKVLIGKTTSSLGDSIVEASSNFYSAGATSGFFWENRSSSSTFAGWYTTSATIYLYQSSVGNIASINYTSGAYTALSDINKKKDFELSTIGLYEVMQLKPTLYRMKSDDTNGAKELGFIAQEVKDYIPQAYVESDGFIGLNDRPMLAAAIKAIQELKLEIDLLKQQ